MVELTKAKKKQLDDLVVPTDRWHEYADYTYNIDVWYKFWTEVFFGDKKNHILDFGSGATWGGFVGTSMGYDVTNLDINTLEVKNGFGLYASILEQEVTYYDGSHIPFFDDEFDAVVAKASIMKLEQSSFDCVITELVRISKANAVWYLSSKGMCRSFLQVLEECADLKLMIDRKNIVVKCWTWRPFEFNRSKSPFTEFSILYRINQLLSSIKKLLINKIS